MNYIKKVLLGTSTVLFMMIPTAIFGYLLRMMMAKSLSIEDFGLFYSMFSFLSMIYGFKELGIGLAFIRYAAEFKANNRLHKIGKYFTSFIVVKMIIFIILAIIPILLSGYLATNYFKDGQAFLGILILTAAFLFTVFSSCTRSLFQAMHDMTLYSVVELIQVMIVLISTFLMLNMGMGILAPVTGYLISFAATSFILLVIALKKYNFLGLKGIDIKAMKGMLKFSGPIAVVRISGSFFNSVDTVILTSFRSLADVGLYNAAMPIATLLRFIPKAMGSIVLPVSSEMYFQKSDELSKAVSRMYRYLLIILLPASLTVMVFAEEALMMLFGKSFIPAARCLQILAIGSLFASMFNISKMILLGTDMPKEYAAITIAGALVITISNLIFAPSLGIVGSAISFVLSNLIMFTTAQILIHKKIRHGLPYLQIISTLIAGSVFFVVVRFVTFFEGYLQMGTSFVLGALAYIALIVILRAVSIEEIIDIVNSIRTK